MKSVGQVSAALPQDFVERLYNFFPALLSDKMLQGFAAERVVSLRVNTLKSSIREVMNRLKAEGIKFDRVLWYDDALIIKNANERRLAKLSTYQEGHLYLQSLSSMVPPLLLAPQPGERVLDLAAAPGSKTTQLAAIMKNRGEIVAVDIDEIRYQRLLHNLKTQGTTIVNPRRTPGQKIGKDLPRHFDRVLLDAPCSGEGLFLANNPQTYRFWKEKQVRRCSALQRRLLRSAIEALQPGGILVYSTCTLAPEENELNVQWVLDNYPSMSVQPTSLRKLPSTPGLTRVGEQRLSKTISQAVRILPSPLMEGFFCCLMQKT